MIKNVPVAIIGMGCFFPKSLGIKQYWRLLFRGEDAVTEVPPTHWSTEDYFNENPDTPDHVYCKRGGFLSHVSFDPTEFGIPPASMEATDTSQLLGLVAAKKALENAGYPDSREFDRSRVSVILGATGTQELVIPLGSRLGHPKWRKALKTCGISDLKADEIIGKISESYVPWQESSFPGLLGNVIAGRICNRLNLGGTNCAVDAACASSMSAVHLALLELFSGKSDLVITGGVDTLNDIFMHMCFAKTRILSPTGDARPFSKNADGTVLGEGIGIIILKRLADAQKDGDRIYAVIKGIGSSSDGKSQSIYAPRAEGQMKALQDAYEQAGINPATVELVEAHGTGTRVGDRVEFQALSNIFENSSKTSCALGSVKSNIGHTKAAAGAAGIIKAALALHHKVLPPTLKADIPDPDLNIHESPFYINTQSRPWIKNAKHPRRAGVSAFGFGGSNFHMVLEEYDNTKTFPSWHGSLDIFSLSSSNRESLEKKLLELKHHIEKNFSPEDIIHAAAKSRAEFSHKDSYRLLFTINPEVSFSDQINRVTKEFSQSGHDNFRKSRGFYFGPPGATGKLAFMFPGQGSQYLHMGRDLLCTFPEALESLENAESIFEQITDLFPLADYIYPKGHSPAAGLENNHDIKLQQTHIAQPAIGTISLGFVNILKRFGILPEAACGHSFGELTALWSAGRISDRDFLTLSVRRGDVMFRASDNRGAMTAVKAPLDKLEKIIQQSGTGVVLANKNSSEQGVLSGTEQNILKAESICRDNGFVYRRLPVSGAFHTPLMKTAHDAFGKFLSDIHFVKSDIPVFSNTTGNMYPEVEEDARKLLADQMLFPVEFAHEIENMYDFGVRTFLEAGPKNILTGLTQSILKGRSFHALSLDSSAGKGDGLEDLANTLCHLSALGYPVKLDQWEQPSENNLRKQRMSIALSGANIRVGAKKRKQAAKFARPNDPKEIKNTFKSNGQPLKDNFSNSKEPDKPIPYLDNLLNKQHKIMTNQNKNVSEQIQSALRVVRDGMKSMQTLQRQTAETHKKFLETQTEAGRMLQQMMAHTQRLAEVAMGVAHDPLPAVEIPHQKQTDIQRQPISDWNDASSEPVTVNPPETLFSEKISFTQPNNNHLEKALLSVVSDLTGYPAEMLGLDMDIESDLGIDSIKRVEILSSLEEKMPGLPHVSPENMGRLKTLGQVLQHLGGGVRDIEPSDRNITPAPGENFGKQEKDNTVGKLLSIVSELTGYPVEMLGLDMDIESDLGIDSIKRVEILSALEEKVPDIPHVPPEMMGKMKTLGQILAHLPKTGSEPLYSKIDRSFTTDELTPNEPQDGLKSSLLNVVSELTGYPEEMLGLDMDIESDLGIDSIKRVEILSALELKIPNIPPVTPEKMGKMKTLGQIVDYLTEKDSDIDRNLKDSNPENPTTYMDKPHTPPDALSVTTHQIDRKIITLVDAPAPSQRTLTFPSGRKILIAGIDESLSNHVVEQFTRQNVAAEFIPVNAHKCREKLPKASGLVILGHQDINESFLLDALMLAKNLSGDLQDSALESCAMFATVSFLDGAFGFKQEGLSNPDQGGLAGLVKTASIEWPHVTCRALDMDPDSGDTSQISCQIVSELLQSGLEQCVEIGLGKNGRLIPALVSAPVHDSPLKIGKGDVVVVSGGARGVTARTILTLAEEVPATFILIGRSPLVETEPSWLKDIYEVQAIRQAIIENEFKNMLPTPAQVEKVFKNHMAHREIRENLRKIRQKGANVRYIAANVCDEKDVFEAITNVRSQFGPIKAIVHGAGVLEDRLIKDKTPEQFTAVFDTKVNGLRNLLKATPDKLQYLIIFSSLTARFGNSGQADYAMANEVLNKIAQSEAFSRQDCRVVSINWGPWDGGMVNASLKKEFLKRNVPLIPMESGGRFMVQEMRANPGAPVEVIIGAPPILKGDHSSIEDRLQAHKFVSNEPRLSLTFKRELDLKRCPVLGAHILDGKPVVPFALMTEWLGCGALHENPGLVLQGLDNLHVLNGIKLEQDKKTIRLMAGKARKKGSTFEVDVEIRDGFKDGIEVIHSRARAILADDLLKAPDFDKSAYVFAEGYSKSIREIYEQILFHGVQLQGIKKIFTCTPGSMAAEIACAPSPDQWMENPIRSRWIADPLVLDCAFQMAIIWCFEQKEMVCLPCYAESYRQYRRTFPTGNITAVFVIKDVNQRKLRGDFTFLDRQDLVVAQLFGYEALIDPKLINAFK
jgi:acyl transferase domain-containing protein/NAD(P)-dependent dehydrogenase (short-subunit alcohol dehydrogenase family)/acyl carrier protein